MNDNDFTVRILEQLVKEYNANALVAYTDGSPEIGWAYNVEALRSARQLYLAVAAANGKEQP